MICGTIKENTRHVNYEGQTDIGITCILLAEMKFLLSVEGCVRLDYILNYEIWAGWGLKCSQ